jgi:glycosyltransferase involved in cell wall biosynthesis
MILFCELSFPDGTHVPFNAALLATVQIAYPKERLQFFGAAKHIEQLKQQVGTQLASSIDWDEIIPPSLGTSYFKRFLREFSVIRPLLKALPREDSMSWLVLTSAYPSTILAFKAARWVCWGRSPVQIVLHGLSGVVGRRYRHPIRRFQDTRTALTLFGNNGIKYLVLETSIRDTILKSLPFLEGHVEVLDHPVSPNEEVCTSSDLSWPFRFGFLGLALKSKGFGIFVDVANAMSSKFERCVEFHAIGRVADDAAPAKGAEVLTTKPTITQIARADFIKALSQLHFVVLPHEAASYMLTASGVLLDAIAFEKPIIARKIPIFEEIFEKHGDIGYLFDSDAELGSIVEKIIKAADKQRYYRQVRNLRILRKSRTPDSLATTYREICKRYVGGRA